MMLNTVNGKGSAEATADPALPYVTSPAASTGLRRFHPADGLFLRAEHLDQIQSYASDLALLHGIAGGSGVVFGYRLDLNAGTETLGATAGLAVDPSGRPLRSRGRLEVDLSDLERDVVGRIWVVEVVAADPIPSGSEPLYSAVCASPCGPESSIRPYLDEAVQLRVRAETLDGDWVNATADRVRSAVASAFFDRERRAGGPWLTPSAAGATIPELSFWPWSAATPAGAPAPGGVPVGILTWLGGSDGAWQLDVWMARRDRMLTPPAVSWQNHLSLRPLPVFTAQLLQFEDQLSTGAADPDHPLTDRFVELPPAGYLPRPLDLGEQNSLEAWLDASFGFAVQLQVDASSADVAISAVNLAQHMDRIPLTGNPDPPPRVHVLVPEIEADLPAVHTDRYPWMAFAREPQIRRRETDRPTPPPQSAAGSDVGEAATLGVHVLRAPIPRAQYLPRALQAVTEPPTAELSFDGWTIAPQPKAIRAVRDAVDAIGPHSMVDVLATTADPARAPLVAARARALAEHLGLDDGQTPAGVYSRVVDGPEAVFLMVRAR
jgi:hypothetical protein